MTTLVLMFRRQARLSRERANAVQSRDRANIDLQMIIHRTEGKLEPSQRPASSKGGVSLPPGPPSSSAGDSVAAQEEVLRSVAPSSWRTPPFIGGAPSSGGGASRKRRADGAASSGVSMSTLSNLAQMVPTPAVTPDLTVPDSPMESQLHDLAWLARAPWAPPATNRFVPGHVCSASASGSSISAPPAAPAPGLLVPAPQAPAQLAPAPPAPEPPAPEPKTKKGFANAYINFCKEQRPLLPPGLGNAAREAKLGQIWKAFSDAQKAKYQTGGTPYYDFCREQVRVRFRFRFRFRVS